MEKSETIIEIENGPLLEIHLNRPDQLNAFNEEMSRAFITSLEGARDDERTRAILITGRGRGFCSGQDLGNRNPDTMSEAPDLEKTISELYNPLVKLIREMPKPVICAVNGVAAGAGVNIAIACDIVVANEKAKFIQSFSKVGLIPDAGGSWMLPRLIGEARAKALSMTAFPLPARQAVEWGLIWSAHDENEFLGEARQLAVDLANGPTIGLGLTKQAIQNAVNQSYDFHLTQEAKFQGICGRSNDYKEGVRAFLGKRTPNFEGN
ncbi:MAG: 2-(1,2-epoxy-1,2-dihydrophenyl)acetyl-CoA isomerase PaaG [Paracoccaceae bacterium]|nr:2-(1,2-epoxy-1,2-dihydrophenyl)acetyl-CoA isomerase PaaG [Paracoccaceae bacterium]